MKVEISVKQDGTWLNVDIPGGEQYSHRLETLAEEAKGSLLAKMCQEIRTASELTDATP